MCMHIAFYVCTLLTRINMIRIYNQLDLAHDDRYKPVESPCGTAYVGGNPLLKNAVVGTVLPIDSGNLYVPANGLFPISSGVYAKQVNDVGKLYGSYNDVHAGQMVYYEDESTRDAFIAPNFPSPMVVETVVKRDPNAIPYYQYDRTSLVPCMWDSNWKCVPGKVDPMSCRSTPCNSDTHDQLYFRQNMMATQMRKMNQQKYTAAWQYCKI